MKDNGMTTVTLAKKDLELITGNRSQFIREAILAKIGLCGYSLTELLAEKKKLKAELKQVNILIQEKTNVQQ